ncbi:hypothetical protein ONZ43_g1955 [Nemania bipapillata]|uniref:Uncharacterized protein n=1 Tax=Nemania bipapillata TaxID=110536 RepID=A0ACC2J2U0_9PEZI|nr:hypothetical protein ONZ43_g1955 [Nemania bipapillata]
MSTRTGSCLCDGVKVVIEGAPVWSSLCHCTSCQKSSGGTFSPLAVFKTSVCIQCQAQFPFSHAYCIHKIIMIWTDNTYNDTSPESGRILKRMFCGRCGSSLGGIRGGSEDTTIILIGLLNGDKSDLRPQFEFFHKSKVDWIAPMEGSQCFECLPPES